MFKIHIENNRSLKTVQAVNNYQGKGLGFFTLGKEVRVIGLSEIKGRIHNVAKL